MVNKSYELLRRYQARLPSGRSYSKPLTVSSVRLRLTPLTVLFSFNHLHRIIYTPNITSIPFYNTQYLISQVLLGVFFFAISIFVYVKNPNQIEAVVYHWGMMACTVIIFTTWGKYSIEPFGIGHFIRIVFSTAYALTPVLFLHFTFVFPKDKLVKFKKLLVPLYAFSAILTLAMAATFIKATMPISVEQFEKFKFVFDICRTFFAVCIASSIINFIYSYRTAVEESERRKLKWILFGLTIGPIGFIGLWVIPQTLTSRGLVNEKVILFLMAVVPITFAISIMKYHIMNIDVILRRGTLYTIVLGIVLMFYAVFLGLMTIIVGTLTVTSSVILASFAAVFIALLFDPLKNKVRHFVDKKFFHVQYTYREAERKFTSEIENCIDETSLAKFIVESIDELIPINKIGFFQIDQKSKTPQILSQKNIEEDILENIRLKNILVSNKVPTMQIELVEYGTANYVDADNHLFLENKLALAFPFLSENSDLLGFLLLGEKKSGFRFSIEDIDLFNSVSVQCGLALERIRLNKNLMIEKLESKRLQELSQLKSYFVSSVSHELKTPLTSIKMFAEILKDNETLKDETSAKYLSIIEGESDRLGRLINNVLDFAKIEKGVKEYNFSETDLNKITENVMETMQYQFEIQKCKVNLELTESNTSIYADEDAISEALMNLLSNSIKYSGENKIISVETFIEDLYTGISVEDNGVGISKEDLKNIFEPFFRASGNESRSVSGACLGLAIVKHTVDAHSGQIKIESEIGKGSKFILMLPQKTQNKNEQSK